MYVCVDVYVDVDVAAENREDLYLLPTRLRRSVVRARCIYMYVCMCRYVYTYIYIYMHTYIYIYIYV